MTDHLMLAKDLVANEHNDAATAHATIAVAEMIAAATMTLGDALSTLAPMLLGHVDPMSLLPTPSTTPESWQDPTLDQAVAEVVNERLRQILQGWSFEHDDEHGLGHLHNLILGYLHDRTIALPPRSDLEVFTIVAALAIAGVQYIHRHEEDAR